jgi:hypothetical protein
LIAKENQLPSNKQPRSLPPLFGGFYLKDDKISSSTKLDKNSTLSNEQNVQIGDNIVLEESIEKILETSENQEELTNYTENTVIENTSTTTEMRAESQ